MTFGFPFAPFGFPFAPFGLPFGAFPFGLPFAGFGFPFGFPATVAGGTFGAVPVTTVATSPVPGII